MFHPAGLSTILRRVQAALRQDHYGDFHRRAVVSGQRCRTRAVAGTNGVVSEVSRILGYDFTPHLPTLWFDKEPDAARYRADYNRALRVRLEETFYEPISRWCSEHGVALTGHPEKPDDIDNLRWFHIPGQDIVWRYIEPGKPSALEGAQSTQAKCAASAMAHLGRRRNLNEFCGAYGPDMTFEEMQWLAAGSWSGGAICWFRTLLLFDSGSPR